MDRLLGYNAAIVATYQHHQGGEWQLLAFVSLFCLACAFLNDRNMIGG